MGDERVEAEYAHLEVWGVLVVEVGDGLALLSSSSRST
jgi:hypothetical protein